MFLTAAVECGLTCTMPARLFRSSDDLLVSPAPRAPERSLPLKRSVDPSPAPVPDRLWSRRHRLVGSLLGLALIGGFVTRVVLLAKAAGEVTWDDTLIAAFAWGTLFDLGAALWGCLPVAIGLAVLPARLFQRRIGTVMAGFTVLLALYGLLFGAVAEWFFWDEFGVRFNFIAVDYLVYTTEVIGNIRESYPMPVIFGLVGLASGLGTLGLLRAGFLSGNVGQPPDSAAARWRTAAAWTMAALIVGVPLHESALPAFANVYNRELAKNGVWSFVAAFRANQLSFESFYPTQTTAESFARIRQIVGATAGDQPAADAGKGPATAPTVTPDILRWVANPGPEQRLNVIQITVESLSADFLAHFGNAQAVTPNLDALIPRALVFDSLYATGNRTDRGMEALALSVPPTPGRSLIKRPDNAGLFTLGSVFRSRGYITEFIYGGYGYFDNMNTFFGGNGYKVIDRTSVEKSDVTYANVWGACDEDLFRWTMREADEVFAQGRPFFQFVMTTSNHRPFTFPADRIDLPSKTAGRSGAVKYTDYAIGEFLRDAATHPWFNQTVFVIVADHCASSAGKSELPVQNYHIPMLIFTPGGQIKPGVVTTVASQIDFAPTLLGLLGWSYPSRFYGRDLLALPPGTPGRALIGNYQKLGLFQDGKLVVLQPVRQSATFAYSARSHDLTRLPPDSELTTDAIAYYQTASWLFAHGLQRELPPGAVAP